MESKENFRLKLFEIASELTTEKLESFKFLCADFIPAGVAEDIQTFEQLFKELEQRDIIAPNRLDFLQECLEKLGRVDLANKLKTYERECGRNEAGKGQPFVCGNAHKNKTYAVAIRTAPVRRLP